MFLFHKPVNGIRMPLPTPQAFAGHLIISLHDFDIVTVHNLAEERSNDRGNGWHHSISVCFPDT
jgi:hypothetical protein